MRDRDYSSLLMRRGEIELWPDSPRRAEFLAAADKALDAMEAVMIATRVLAEPRATYTLWERLCWRWFRLFPEGL